MKYLAPILLVAMWVVVGVIFLTPEAPHSQGIAHSRVDGMDQGGSAAERHGGGILAGGWLFGSLVIALFVSLLAWVSLDPAESPSRLSNAWAFLIGGLIFEAVFAAMCLAYARSLDAPLSEPFWGPFPLATAWLLFGIWPVPAVFIVLYVVYFDRWICPPSHLARFRDLVSKPPAPDRQPMTDQWNRTAP